MIELFLIANLRQPDLTCIQIREIAETVIESDLSDEAKQRFLYRLFGRNMTLKCFKK